MIETKWQTYNIEIRARVSSESVKGTSGCHPFFISVRNNHTDFDAKGS